MNLSLVKENDVSNYILNRYEFKKLGHETFVNIYGLKENLEIDYDKLLFTISNICLLPKTQYNKIIEKSHRKELTQKVYNVLDTNYEMLYKQILIWYFNKIDTPDFKYKLVYKDFIQRKNSINSCPIISDVSEVFYSKMNINNVISKVVKYLELNNELDIDEALYINNSNFLKRQKTELGKLVIDTILNVVFYRSSQFIRSDASRHILDAPVFFEKMDSEMINKILIRSTHQPKLSFCAFFKLNSVSITVKECYEILCKNGFIIHQKNYYKVFKSIFNLGKVKIHEKIDWNKDIKTLVYFLQLLHVDDKDYVAPCEKNSQWKITASNFFTVKKKFVSSNSFANNNRALKNKSQISYLKKAVNSLIEIDKVKR